MTSGDEKSKQAIRRLATDKDFEQLRSMLKKELDDLHREIENKVNPHRILKLSGEARRIRAILEMTDIEQLTTEIERDKTLGEDSAKLYD